MTHRRNQRPLHRCSILKSENGQWNFNFPQVRLVHVKNLRGMLQGLSSMMVNGLQKSEVALRKAAQGVNQWDWNREAREAALREKEEHDRSVEEWKAQVEGRGFPDHPAIPFGPPPKGTSSMRVLPNVHEALRQNDPSMSPGSQPVLKKAPPSAGRPRPKASYSESEPARIGTTPVQPPPPPKPVNPWDVQPQGIFHPLTATPMTPGNPPRPPIEALPKPMPTGTSQATHKHPLPQPAQQGPPNKQVLSRGLPFNFFKYLWNKKVFWVSKSEVPKK